VAAFAAKPMVKEEPFMPPGQPQLKVVPAATNVSRTTFQLIGGGTVTLEISNVDLFKLSVEDICLIDVLRRAIRDYKEAVAGVQ
jgi:hypothetical protein